MNDKDILNLIPYGKENAVTRDELCRMTGYDERSVRGAIHRLRAKGEFIMSSSHSVGYWRTEDMNEVKAFIGECDSRRNKLTMPEMKRRYYAAAGQKMTVVREHLRKIG